MKKDCITKEIILTILIALIFTLLFNSKAYINWAINLKLGIFREICLVIFKPIDKTMEKLYLDTIYKKSRSLFLNLIKKKDNNQISKENKDIIGTKENELFSTQNPLKIIMLGDSMIKEALSMAFLKLTMDNTDFKTDISAYYSSGLSRMDIFNWFQQLDFDFTNKKYQVAIVMLGMNDAQDILENEKKVPLFSEEWESIYRIRLKKFLEKLNQNVKKIIWIGLPFMRDKRYNERMIKLNAIIKNECELNKNILFIDPNQILYNNTEYKEYIKIKNSLVQVRLYDGKHFTKEGAILIMEEAIKLIYNNFKFESLDKLNRAKFIDIEFY